MTRPSPDFGSTADNTRCLRRTCNGSARFAVLMLLLVGLLAAGVWFGFFRTDSEAGSDRPLTAPLSRGPLRITVLESGNLESLKSHKVINMVEGRTAIDYVIPEGTVLTEDDVRNKTVLVRLNTATLEEKRVRQEIEVSAARDGHANASTGLEIQFQQSASDLRKANLSVRFAHLDLERYVGKAFAEQLLAVANEAVIEITEGGTDAGTEQPEDVTPRPRGNAGIVASLRRLISSLLDSTGLEGEGLQRIRQLTSDIRLADEEFRRAEQKLKHSVTLEAKGYVSSEDLEADRLGLERREIERQRSRTAREQYVQYDFPKDVEKLLSDVVEAYDQRSRTEKKSAAAEAQKRSAVTARRKQMELKQRRLANFAAQAKACTLYATKPGLVVYASSGSGHWRGNDDRIHEGASVRQGQALITIPDPSSLGVIIKVHETAIDKVAEGLNAQIEVDAAPGQRFHGRVAEVARLPDSADRWLNPDLKVYTTKIQLQGDNPDLKPGMSAQVEVLITTLPDVLAAPVQTIAGTADRPVVYIWRDGEAIRQKVELGLASEHLVEIKSGVEVGDRLLLDPPRETRRDQQAGGAAASQAPAGSAGEKPAQGTAKPRGYGKRSHGAQPGGAGPMPKAEQAPKAAPQAPAPTATPKPAPEASAPRKRTKRGNRGGARRSKAETRRARASENANGTR